MRSCGASLMRMEGTANGGKCVCRGSRESVWAGNGSVVLIGRSGVTKRIRWRCVLDADSVKRRTQS